MLIREQMLMSCKHALLISRTQTQLVTSFKGAFSFVFNSSSCGDRASSGNDLLFLGGSRERICSLWSIPEKAESPVLKFHLGLVSQGNSLLCRGTPPCSAGCDSLASLGAFISLSAGGCRCPHEPVNTPGICKPTMGRDK